MPDEKRIQDVLEAVLSSQRTPEEVCASDPELLREVRTRWERLRRVGYHIDALFPPDEPTKRDNKTNFNPEIELPEIRGYEVESILGRGGAGVVFKARHLKLNRIVALKMLLAGAYAGPEELGRFRREAEAVAALRHPNIVPVYDAGEVTDRPYFTMEYVEGGTLAQSLATGQPPPRRAAELVATLASAVQFAHQSGFIHRDLKPGNILLAREGTPKISDFGLARSIANGPEFTLTGARLGTPSYMAPEQAMGRTSAIGPAVDIYALGAVLYELLTGRPPFDGQSAAETVQRVTTDELAPPSRLNSRVPRDLETICLKCLQKNPSRRYASAQGLADDLHRFLDGKPVLARPIGVLERIMKWVQRRPTLALLTLTLFASLAAAFSIGIWLHQREAMLLDDMQKKETLRQMEKSTRQAAAQQAIKTGIHEAYRAAKDERFQDALVILNEARGHIPSADSQEWKERIADVEAEVRFHEQLENIRLRAVYVNLGGTSRLHTADFKLLATEYRKAFAERALDIDGDPVEVAARIEASVLGSQTVAALDEWARAAFVSKRAAEHRKLLHIARLADRGSAWRDRFRDPAAWQDLEKLRELAKEAFALPEPPQAHQLGIIAMLFEHLGTRREGTRFLVKAVRHRPNDCWLNWEMACSYFTEGKYMDAIPFLRVVVAIRPRNPGTTNVLAYALMQAGECDECIELGHRAVSLAPDVAFYRYTLMFMLLDVGRWNEAIEEGRRYVEANPNSPRARLQLAVGLGRVGRHEDAIAACRKAIGMRPGNFVAGHRLGLLLWDTGRQEQAVVELQKAIDELATQNSSGLTEELQMYGLSELSLRRDLGSQLQGIRRHAEALVHLEWVAREVDPRQPRADPGRAMVSDYIDSQIRLVRSYLALGRFTDAYACAQRAFDLLPANRQHEQRALVDICKLLVPLEFGLADYLIGDKLVQDAATEVVLAECCLTDMDYPAASARLFDSVLQKNPPFGDERIFRYRLLATCAAARAGCGLGEDGAKLDDKARADLRKKALNWLSAERDRWMQRRKQARPGELPAETVTPWLHRKELACVRDEAALATLPEDEREKWQRLWGEVKDLALCDAGPLYNRARAHADRGQWAEAAACYARLKQNDAFTFADQWFECAAVHLLAGDRDHYERTYRHMLTEKMLADKRKSRPYLVARTCTLAPISASDVSLASRIAARELTDSRTAFWSLTEQGALCVRTNSAKDAIGLLQESLDSDKSPGAAVLNWLWLALAYQKLGNTGEAHAWLNKADAWFESVGSVRPTSPERLSGLHLHNWLEAHILRREAESLLSPKSAK